VGILLFSRRTGVSIAKTIQREGAKTMQILFRDVRVSIRTLLGNPGFSLIAVLILALAIAANSTIFSWMSSTIFDPIPGVTETSNLISLMKGEWNPSPVPPFSYPDYSDLVNRTRSFSGLLGYHDFDMALTGEGKPERVRGVLCSGNYFEVLGVRPLLGRGFLPSEDDKPGGAAVALISYGLWQRRFGADPSVVGKYMEINQRRYSIIGVTPPAFHGCKLGLNSDVWVPLTMDPVITGWRRYFRRDSCWLQLIGRLRPGIDRGMAQVETNSLMQQLVTQYPDSHQGANEITLDPLWRSTFGMSYVFFTGLSLLQALGAVLFLLACANVSNLMLVRSVERRREIAIRLSLGASRWQLVRQSLIESLLLASAAAAASLIVTSWAAASLASLLPTSPIPYSFDSRVDLRVLFVTLLIAVASGVVTGILPALRSSRLGPATVMKEEGRAGAGGLHRSRLAGGLVIAQISLSFLLLISAGLFLRSYQNTLRTDLGFDADHVLLCSFDLLPTGYSIEQGKEFDRLLLTKLESLPGVESVTLANWVPFMGKHTQDIVPKGYVPRPHESMEVGRANVGPKYFRTLRIPLLSGRDFTANDTDKSQPVVIVNAALADRFWPAEEPLGKQIQAYGRWLTVVGVARNSKSYQMRESARPMIFLPLSQVYYHDSVIHLRVTGNPYDYRTLVEDAVHQLNSDVPLYNIISLDQIAENGNAAERAGGVLTALLGMLALALTSIGIYGVIAYTARQRTYEIGIRMALGARPSSIRSLVLLQGLRLTLVGLAIGLVMALVLGPSLKTLLFGVEATDTVTYCGVALVLCLTALLACFIPARRAAAGNPITALRHE